jgi:hypothetical protein
MQMIGRIFAVRLTFMPGGNCGRKQQLIIERLGEAGRSKEGKVGIGVFREEVRLARQAFVACWK